MRLLSGLPSPTQRFQASAVLAQRRSLLRIRSVVSSPCRAIRKDYHRSIRLHPLSVHVDRLPRLSSFLINATPPSKSHTAAARSSIQTNPCARLSPTRTAELPDRSPVIDVYLAEHKKLQRQSQQGIDYKSAMRPGQLSLASFANLLSKLLGRSGSGLSAFDANEQISLDTFIRKYPQVRSLQVQEAAERAAGEGFVSVLWQLDCLLKGEQP